MTGRKPAAATDTPWFTSSYSNAAAACVEVRFAGDAVLVRDSKDRTRGPILAVTPNEWAAFLDGLSSPYGP
ncbi:MAG: DUF397 domain-containing protein [Actinomycetota bacterium]|nr:DUF397 domain-containing protein [Actinomycetota bacterium]